MYEYILKDKRVLCRNKESEGFAFQVFNLHRMFTNWNLNKWRHRLGITGEEMSTCNSFERVIYANAECTQAQVELKSHTNLQLYFRVLTLLWWLYGSAIQNMDFIIVEVKEFSIWKECVCTWPIQCGWYLTFRRKFSTKHVQ